MSKITAVFELPGMTAAQYNAIVHELKAQGKLPDERRPSHIAFQKGGNWCVVDIWNSEADLMEFGQTTLFPIFAKLGITPTPPAIYPLHHYIGANLEEYIEA
jgi:hypothetical protein